MSGKLPPLDKLDLEGDSTSVGLRWEKWKRSLSIYLEAADIVDQKKQRATLLVFGGSGLQEIFYNLPGANIDAIEGANIFEIAVKKLDEYFLPKQNKTYERHIFRLIKQDDGESFEKFVIKLRDQASKCMFEKPEENIIDQIIEKCVSPELRKKVLIMGNDVTLDKVLAEANTLQLVNYQLESYEKNKTNDVNEINRKITKFEPGKRTFGYKNARCDRCGRYSHNTQDADCPAKKRKCHRCGIIGHYQSHCRKPMKGKIEEKEDENKYNYKKQRMDTSINNLEDETVQYIFNMNSDRTIACNLGGVLLDMLIDSGCKINVITDQTWDYLKNNNVVCCNQVKEPNEILLAYGSKSPLIVKGSFDTTIKINGRADRSTFFVIENGSRNLLGKITAIRLGVLKLGIGIDQ